MSWSFYVAGCVATPAREGQFCNIADQLQPAAMFGPVNKGYTIMKEAWRRRREEEIDCYQDFGAWFQGQGGLFLLI